MPESDLLQSFSDGRWRHTMDTPPKNFKLIKEIKKKNWLKFCLESYITEDLVKRQNHCIGTGRQLVKKYGHEQTKRYSLASWSQMDWPFVFRFWVMEGFWILTLNYSQWGGGCCFGKDQKTRWQIDPGLCETEAKSGEVFNQYGGKGEGGRVSKYSIKISPCALVQTTSWKILDFASCVIEYCISYFACLKDTKLQLKSLPESVSASCALSSACATCIFNIYCKAQILCPVCNFGVILTPEYTEYL